MASDTQTISMDSMGGRTPERWAHEITERGNTAIFRINMALKKVFTEKIEEIRQKASEYVENCLNEFRKDIDKRLQAALDEADVFDAIAERACGCAADAKEQTELASGFANSAKGYAGSAGDAASKAEASAEEACQCASNAKKIAENIDLSLLECRAILEQIKEYAESLASNITFDVDAEPSGLVFLSSDKKQTDSIIYETDAGNVLVNLGFNNE